MKAKIDPEGKVLFIYGDNHPLSELGPSVTTRASHVEPTGDGFWQADMSPVGGPKLPKTVTRQESLDQEVAWIENRVL